MILVYNRLFVASELPPDLTKPIVSQFYVPFQQLPCAGYNQYFDSSGCLFASMEYFLRIRTGSLLFIP